MNERDPKDSSTDESIVLHLMRRELIEVKNRSDDTVETYVSIGRRFEEFARGRKPPIEPELMDLDEAVEVAQQFAQEKLRDLAPSSMFVYESALAEYMAALDDSFTRESLILPETVTRASAELVWAGRQAPSTPLTNKQLWRLRRTHDLNHRPLWLRTVIELGISGLTWDEILRVNDHQVSHFGDPPRIMMLERTIPIHETKTAEWLRGGGQEIFPATANHGRPISVRLAKRELASAIARCRDSSFGPGQGLRALHRTGARRLLRRGKPESEIRRIYRRVKLENVRARAAS